MAKCNKCGKRGLFLKVNSYGLCADCAKKQTTIKITREVDSLRRELAQQDKDLEILLKAEKDFEDDNDIAKLIVVYEDIFIKQKSTLNSQSRWFKLVDLYLKLGQNDKAWGWLNQLAITHPEYTYKIDEKRYKILKKEGKHLMDAMFYLMSSIGHSQGNAGYAAYYQEFGRKKFLKEAPSLIKKLKWDDTDLAALEAMLASTISKNNVDFHKLRKLFKEYIGSKQG